MSGRQVLTVRRPGSAPRLIVHATSAAVPPVVAAPAVKAEAPVKSPAPAPVPPAPPVSRKGKGGGKR